MRFFSIEVYNISTRNTMNTTIVELIMLNISLNKTRFLNLSYYVCIYHNDTYTDNAIYELVAVGVLLAVVFDKMSSKTLHQLKILFQRRTSGR